MPVNTPLNQQLDAVYPLAHSRLEDIDYALYNYINDQLNIFTDSNTGFSKVPVIYSIPDRAYQIKNDPTLRPNGRTLSYPLISILRESVTKNPENKGRYGVHVPPYFDYYDRGGAVTIAREVNQSKTKNFANAAAIKKSFYKTNTNYQTFPGVNTEIVYETLTIPMPTFVEVSYSIGIICEYQQQMNQILAPFAAQTGAPSVFPIKYEGNKYEAFIEPEFAFENNSTGLELQERIFKTNISLKVLGYLVGSDKNQETPNVVRRQSAAKLIIQRERVVLGDEPYFDADHKDKYRP